MYTAPDKEAIITLFDNYIKYEETLIPTLPGFKKYLLQIQKFPPILVRDLILQASRDKDLKFLISSVSEAFLVEGALIGTIKENMAKFILKNHMNYKDSPETKELTRNQTTKQITIIPAKRAKDE